MDLENKELTNPNWVDAPYEALAWNALTGEVKIITDPEELHAFFASLTPPSL